ncbi:hypothetical protein MPH_05507 [Macrophomina phaseolina MS6]|uniref:Uncharacterized protein n=1 Tax=Macrophomina phaseolina (strain MS6) TaxID=1126212 RepID=K2RX37_MACPH|nr:hypothetical protein MPH_05507 [Macrophomina phaseolina MS6]
MLKCVGAKKRAWVLGNKRPSLIPNLSYPSVFRLACTPPPSHTRQDEWRMSTERIKMFCFRRTCFATLRKIAHGMVEKSSSTLRTTRSSDSNPITDMYCMAHGELKHSSGPSHAYFNGKSYKQYSQRRENEHRTKRSRPQTQCKRLLQDQLMKQITRKISRAGDQLDRRERSKKTRKCKKR